MGRLVAKHGETVLSELGEIIERSEHDRALLIAEYQSQIIRSSLPVLEANLSERVDRLEHMLGTIAESQAALVCIYESMHVRVTGEQVEYPGVDGNGEE